MVTFENLKNVLILAPHTDDGELGCGGTISKLVKSGVNIRYVAFSTAHRSLPKHLPTDTLRIELINAASVLGLGEDNLVIFDYEVRKLNYSRQEILESLIKIKKETPVDLVFMPSLKDIHQDHKTVAEEGLRAFKNTTILGYELIWNNLQFATTCFVKLDESHIKRKVLALKEYKSQAGKSYTSPEFIYSLAKTRGVQVGTEYAESFEVIRLIVS